MIIQILLTVHLSTPILMKHIPVPSPLIQQAPQSIDFLKKYGYLIGTSGGALEALYTKESVENAIKEAQRFGGIKETGSLNDETIELFSSKRCGLPDVIRNVTAAESSPSGDHNDHLHHNHHYTSHHHHRDHIQRRKKRYVLNGNSWTRRHLKYYINNWSQSLSQSEIVGELEKTLRIWGEYGNLRFSRTSDPSEAEISVGFYRGQHGDRNPFDGRGNVLAHAFFPDSRDGRGLAGDVHFDDDEAWSVGRVDSPFKDTVDFTSVALHELGHSLGLHHSPEQGSVMNPYYRGKIQLGDDDVHAMYELYVKKSMLDYDEESSRRDEDTREDEGRRRYDEERRHWEEKRREVERKRLEEEERKKSEEEREQKRRKYEEEERIRKEQLKRQEEERKYELDRKRQEEERKYQIQRRRDEEERRRYEEERERRKAIEREAEWKRVEYEIRKAIEKEDEWRRQEDERKKIMEKELKRKREEEERRKFIEEEINRKRQEDEKRKWIQEHSTDKPPKHDYPKGTTFEGDDESVESHKTHDSTHRIPPTQNPHDHHKRTDPSQISVGCNGGFSAATFLRGELFLLRENMLWRLSRPGAVHQNYPVEVHRFFHLLPEEVKNIDAMYQRDRDSSLMIFSGAKYWVFGGFKISGPRLLQDYGLPQDVERIDAITSRNGQVLIFSGNRYWGRNDTVLEFPLQRQPPRPISSLRGLPDGLDAALTYNDVMYFFKDDRFWYMDPNSDEAVLHSTPASDYWVGC